MGLNSFLLLLTRRNKDSSNNSNNKSNNGNSNPPNAISGGSRRVENSALREQHRYSGGEQRTVAHAAADSAFMSPAGSCMAHVGSHGADISWATALGEPEFDIDGPANWTNVDASLLLITPDAAGPRHCMGYHTGGEEYLNDVGGLEWPLSTRAFTPCSTVCREPHDCPMEGVEEGLAMPLASHKQYKRSLDDLDMASEYDAIFGPSAFLNPMGGSVAMGDDTLLGLAALHNPPGIPPWGSSDEAMGDDALLGLVEQSPGSKRRRSSSASVQGHVCCGGLGAPFFSSSAPMGDWWAAGVSDGFTGPAALLFGPPQHRMGSPGAAAAGGNARLGPAAAQSSGRKRRRSTATSVQAAARWNHPVSPMQGSGKTACRNKTGYIGVRKRKWGMFAAEVRDGVERRWKN